MDASVQFYIVAMMYRTLFWESYLPYFILLCLKIELLGTISPDFPIDGVLPRSNTVQLYYFQNTMEKIEGKNTICRGVGLLRPGDQQCTIFGRGLPTPL